MRYVAWTLLVINLGYFGWGAVLRDVPDQARESPRPRLEQGVESLVLLTESDAGARQAQLNQVIRNPISNAAPPAPSLSCTALGPLPDLFSGEAMREQLAALDVGAQLRAIDETTGEIDFRVLIPPASSIEEAFRQLRELKSLGIESYIITQGEDALGISLGVFSTPEAAAQLRAERQRQGYEPEIAELPRVERQFWVFDQSGVAQGARLDSWEQIAASRDGLTVQTLPCPAPG